MMLKHARSALFAFPLFLISAAPADPGTAFTYQARINDGGTPVTGTVSLRFTLHTTATGNSPAGPTVAPPDRTILDGLVIEELDFGPVFTGDPLFLEVEVDVDGGADSFQALGSRTQLLPVPYAAYAENSNIAQSLAGGIDDADADPANELNTGLVLNGNSLELTDADGTLTADLSSLTGFGDGHSLDAADGDPVDVVFVDAEGDVGIGTATPDEALTIEDGNILQTPGDPILVSSLGIGGNPTSVYVSGRYAYIVDQDSGDLKVIDVSDPNTPTLTGSLLIGGFPFSLYVSGRYAYVVDIVSDDLKVIDVSDPSAPTLAGSLGIGGDPVSVSVSGRYAYVVSRGSEDLQVIDVSDPGSPSLAGSLSIGSFVSSVSVSGRYAYVVDIGTTDLKVIDVSDPGSPSLAGSLGIGPVPTSVYTSGRYAYVVDTSSTDLKVIDVSDPSSPGLAGSLSLGPAPFSVFVSGRYAYVIDTSSAPDLKVIDVSDPTALDTVGSLSLSGGAGARSLYVSGRYAYVVSNGSDDLKIIDISGAEATSLIAHSLEAGNLQVRNDVIAQGQLQVTGGITAGAGGIFSDGDVAVAGIVGAEKFVGDGSMLTGLADADPANELQTLSFSSPNLSIIGGNSVDLSGLSSPGSGDGHSLDAVDGDPIDAVFVDPQGMVGIGTTTPVAMLDVTGELDSLGIQEVNVLTDGVDFPGLESATDVFVSGTTAYVVSTVDNTLSVIDVSDPLNPALLGEATDEVNGFTGLAGARSIVVAGTTAYVVSSIDDALSIINVANPASPQQLSVARDEVGGFTGLEGASDVFVVGTTAYVASGTDHTLSIIDVSVPTAPVQVGLARDEVGGFTGLDAASGVFVLGTTAYVASKADATLSIIDVSVPATPVELGVARNGLGFTGLDGACAVFVVGTTAYVAAEDSSALSIIDVSVPAAPVELGVARDGVGDFTALLGASGVSVVGTTAYVTSFFDDALTLIDVSDPTAPTLIGLARDGVNGMTGLEGALGLFVDGATVYIASSFDNTLSILDVFDSVTPGFLGLHVSGDAQVEETVTAAAFIGNGSGLTGVDLSDTNELNASLALNGTSLELTDPGGVLSTDLSPLAGSVFGDNHSLDAADNMPVDAVFVDNDGLVGMGTTTPEAFLDIAGQTVFALAEQSVALDGVAPFLDLDAATDVFVLGTTAFIVSSLDDSLSIIDVSDPTSPALLSVAVDEAGGFTGLDGPQGVFVTGTTAYVVSSGDDALSIIDVSDPANPTELGVARDEVGGFTGLDSPQSVFVTGSTAYVASLSDDALSIIDVSTPASPVQLAVARDGVDFPRLNGAAGVFVVGTTVYVTSFIDDSLTIIDASIPTAPVQAGVVFDSIDFPGLNGASGLFVVDETAYVTSIFDNAFSIIDVSDPLNPGLLGLARDNFDGFDLLGGTRDVFVLNSTAYITADTDDTLSIIDVTDPSNLVLLGEATDGVAGFTGLDGATGVFVLGNSAYVASDVEDALSIIQVAAESPLGLRVAGDAEINGAVTATAFVGDGSMLTGLTDADPANELNTGFILNGTTLELTDMAGTLTADLSSLGGSGSGDGHSLDAVDGSPVDALFVESDGTVHVGVNTLPDALDVQGNIQIIGRHLVDQSQVTFGGVGPSNPVQSFTAGITGMLALVELGVAGSNPTGDGTVHLYEGSGTEGNLLASQAYSFPAMTSGMMEITFFDRAMITAGQQYSLQFVASSGQHVVRASNQDPYAGGEMTNGSPGFDLQFLTSVVPPGNEGIGFTDGSFQTTAFTGSVDDADADPTNELQDLGSVLTEGNNAGASNITNVGTLTAADLAVDGTTLNVNPNNDRVGIGITNPQDTLHVVGTTSFASATISPSGAPLTGGEAVLNVFGSSNLNNGAIFGYDGALTRQNIFISSMDGGVERGPHIVIQKDTGHVGIGLSSFNASDTLHVDQSMTISRDTNTEVIGSGNAGSLLFTESTLRSEGFSVTHEFNNPGIDLLQIGSREGSANTNRITLQDDGNVGVGTEAPDDLMHLRKQTATADTPERMLILDSHDDPNSLNLLSGSGAGILFKVPVQNDSQIGAAIDAVRSGGGETNSGTNLVFSVSGDDEILDESLRIAHDGGIFAPGLATGSGSALQYSGDEIVVFASSARFKQNIRPAEIDAEKMLELEPVDFEYTQTGQHSLGYIAEELDEIGLTQLVVYDDEGKPYSIAYQLIPVLQNELIKKHETEIEAQQAEIHDLRRELKELRALIHDGSK